MELAEDEQAEKEQGDKTRITYERKTRKRNVEVQGEEVAGEAQENKRVKIIGKKGKGSTVVVRSPIMTRQKKEQKKD